MKIEFEYWLYVNDDYDNRYEIGEGDTEEECRQDIKKRIPRRVSDKHITVHKVIEQ